MTPHHCRPQVVENYCNRVVLMMAELRRELDEHVIGCPECSTEWACDHRRRLFDQVHELVEQFGDR